jgi:hypothetical protein
MIDEAFDVRAKELRADACAKARQTGINLPSWEDAPEPVRNVYRRIARSEVMEEQQEFAEESEHP